MQDLNDLAYFARVVEHGGFAPAARALGVPKSKLSRRVAALEERLGVRLIQRTSRRFSVTEIGREFHAHCVAMLVEADAAAAAIEQARSEPRGAVRVSCPVALTNFQFGALFARFLMAYPAVTLHIESTNRRVDVTAEGFDVAIRVRFPPLPPSDLVMRRLDESVQRLVAAPALAAASVASPADLAGLPGLDLGPPRGIGEWRLDHADGRSAVVPFRPRLVTDDMAALREAAVAGVGVAQLPTMMIWRDLQSGALVPVLPDWRPASGIVHAVFPSRRGLLPSVRALLDFLAAECGAQRRA
ncbi:LysR substrate-binding domain-containing protein, partial [Rubrimonas cliftonensis]